MKKLLSIVLVLMLLSVSFVSAETKPLKVAMILTGVANDAGWNQIAYEGLCLLRDQYGCEIAYTENCTTADMTAALMDYASAGYDIIFGHSYEFGDPICEVGELYPDTYFISIEGDKGNGANAGSYQLKCQETAYVIGMLAAGMSKANNIGMVSAVQSGSMNKIVNGYEDGAKAYNADINVQKTYTNSYIDTTMGKECGDAVIENGADFVYHCANESGLGALNTAIEKGVYVVGDSYDQSFLSPELVLTSAVYNVPKLVEKAYLDIVNGVFTGTVVEGGMADDIVTLTAFNAAVPAELVEKLNAVMDEMKNGTLQIVADPSVR